MDAMRGGALAIEVGPRRGYFVLIHWINAILLLMAALSGEYFRWSQGAPSMVAYPIMVLHVAAGMAGFALIVPRILARRRVAKPVASGKFDIGRYFACAVYIVIYIFMIAQPLIGWAIVNAKGMAIPVPLLGYELPILVKQDADLVRQLIRVHVALACIFYGLLTIHVSAALWHHFVKRDNTLRNMMSVIGSRG
jgi:superoxide oxidase